ncbi:alpha-(1-_3)-arabinofuranosyltransferase [Nocardioides endophyticus]|uniref:Alpha-(1->3)-arabinofuranosyltransferase n=2 Tax=Nocardioides endophyticus TaxID=1353775 RepID=A0ABP8ZKC1_9ACTN
MVGYAAILTAMAFSQSAGRMVADTKFDLMTHPRGFLAGAMRLWDPLAAFGQIQNQAYGYLWPMGPFFVLGELAHVPEWAIQRAWWSVLLCLAFFGIVRLAQQLDLGSPRTQVVAGFAYVLTPRITTLLGGTSIEVWPMALAPWVLIPLVRGSREGSVRRAAAVSALVVATCGGVNAIAVAAVLPLGVIWLLTRAAGPRKWRLLGWWTLFTGLATLWWSLPLLVMGRYSAPFLDYIENATVTTVPTDLARTLAGTSDWVAYFAGIDYPAGQQLVTSFLLLQAAAVAAFGLAGVGLRSNPHQRFLAWGVLVGIALVGFGYAGDLSGFLAGDRQAWLDGTLAPLRNLHKFDVVLRIPLILGLAHALTSLPALVGGRRDRSSVWAVRALATAAVLAVAVTALPWAQDRIAPREGVLEVPDYWSDVARYLHEHDDGTVSLVIPASAFGVYSWGNVHDDIMQGLAESPWAVRNVIPLAQPGNVAFLDAVTRTIESGRPSDSLATVLATNGVGRLVVRNDLDRFETGAPDPAYVERVLVGSAGISLAESFGPRVGAAAVDDVETPEGDVRVVTGTGIAAEVGSVDVYDVAGARSVTLNDPLPLAGDPGSGFQTEPAGLGAGPFLLADDTTGDEGGAVLTDGNKRREVNFAAVRANRSATMPAIQPYRLNGPEHQHRILRDPDRWQTVETWAGDVSSADASSSQAYADALPPLEVGAHPGAALDHDLATAWRSGRQAEPVGQWWQERFTEPVSVPQVRVTLAAGSAPVERLVIQSGEESVLVPAPAPGGSRTYSTRFTGAELLRITAAGPGADLVGSFSLAEVEVPGVVAQRFLDLPQPDERQPVAAILLERDPDRAACAEVGTAFPCDNSLIAPGEDGDTLARRFQSSFADTYELSATGSLRRTADASALLASGARITSDAVVRDVAEGPVALADGDDGTSWVSQSTDETVRIEFPDRRRIDTLELTVDRGAPVSLPTRVELTSGDRQRVLPVDDDGVVRVPGWRVDELELQVRKVDRAYSASGSQFVELPPGISELEVNGESLNPGTTIARSFPCGTGPRIGVAGEVQETTFTASTQDLIRGRSVPLRLCGSDEVALDAEETTLLAVPTLLRADAVSLRTDDAESSPLLAGVTAHRDSRDAPASVDVPARTGDTVLSLPQNVNPGWRATLDGETLPVVRTDGWKQGWRLPAGDAGTVELSYRPALPFVVLLGVGGLGALVVLLVALWPRGRARGEEQPALVAGTTGLLDVAVVLSAGSLLAGWWGLAGAAVALVVGRLLGRWSEAWAWLAGLAALIGSLALGWDEITDRSWAVTWSQAWVLGGVCLLVAALAGNRQRPGLTSPISRRSRQATPDCTRIVIDE